MRKVIHIDSKEGCQWPETGLIDHYVADKVDDQLIEYIIENRDIDTIQICQYISNSILCKLDRVFIKRPEISFRIYGENKNFDGWNLELLRQMPNLQNLILDSFECRAIDLSVLEEMVNLRGLRMGIFDLKDYTFVKLLPSHLGRLEVFADVKSGKVNFDCQWLLRFQRLHTLSLGKVDTHLEDIVGLTNLKKLLLKGIKTLDLSFLKQITIEELTITWCNGSKTDLSTLSDFETLKRLELWRISKLEDISFISTLRGLQKLELMWLANVTRLPDMGNLKHLTDVKIDTLKNLVDISGLIPCENLTTLNMSGVKLMTKEAVSAVLNNKSIVEMQCWLGGNKKEQDEIAIMFANRLIERLKGKE